MSIVNKSTIFERSATVLLARIEDQNGRTMQIADVATVSVKVIDATSKTIGDVINALPADCFYDTLQTDARWKADDLGYNFSLRLSGDHFPTGDTTYRVEAKIVPSDAAQFSFYVVWELQAINLLGD